MILIKCSCGCHFTLKNETLNTEIAMRPFRCPNCKKSIVLNFSSELFHLHQAIQGDGFEIIALPENAVFNIKCDI